MDMGIDSALQAAGIQRPPTSTKTTGAAADHCARATRISALTAACSSRGKALEQPEAVLLSGSAVHV
jgi:hypothetical protein